MRSWSRWPLFKKKERRNLYTKCTSVDNIGLLYNSIINVIYFSTSAMSLLYECINTVIAGKLPLVVVCLIMSLMIIKIINIYFNFFIL